MPTPESPRPTHRPADPPGERGAVQKLGGHAQSILEWALDAVVAIDHRGRILAWNAQAERVFGWSREEVYGRDMADLLIPDRHRSAHARGMEQFRATGDGPAVSRRLLTEGRHRDGRELPIELTIIPEETAKGFIFTAFIRDLTEQQRAARALSESEERFRSTFAAAPIGMGLCLMDGRMLQVNRAFHRMLGLTEGELVALSLSGITAPEDRPELERTLLRLHDGSRDTAELSQHLVARDGRAIPCRTILALVKDDAGAPRHLVVHVEDISRRQSAEKALRESERNYRLLFEDNPNPMWVYDRETLRFLAVNEAAVARYGYSRAEFRSMTLSDLRPPDDTPPPGAVRVPQPRGITQLGEARHRARDGSDVWVNVTTHGVRFEGRDAIVALLRDVSEERRSRQELRDKEAQLQQSAKMEGIGRLAGGIAHDFNNLLTIIAGYAQLLSRKLDRKESPMTEIEEIRYAAARGSSLTQQLLAFSRRQVLNPKAIDLNLHVAKMDQLLRRVIGENIELLAALQPGIGPVQADPGQLDQVIMNLALNARDAMPSGGRLTIATGEDLKDGPLVTLSVTDTGVGMDEKTLAHVFEPFFTTKREGRGTGLGLATVYGIVEQSGGRIHVTSAPGKGSTFRVWLPRAGAPPQPEATGGSGPPRGSGVVLVVEDDLRVRRLAATLLRDTGYTVLEAETAGEALVRIERLSEPLDLLLADVVLPGKSGVDLAMRALSLRPNLRVVLTSGYPDSEASRLGALPPGTAFLPKPFTEESLSRCVRETLQAPR
ncbi:MAG: PAS domain S-box protein [Candidatus Brocadiae bacterium]|nr:PAS domain S-box protein [Candidatus Brocadiia bacterium]